MTTRITQTSHDNLIAAGYAAWQESDNHYYVVEDLIPSTDRNLINPLLPYKIYDYVNHKEGDETEWPGAIIFPEQLNIHLPKKSLIQFGERINSTYYRDQSYTDPVIKVDYVFHRDIDGYLLYKERIISWQKTDNSWCPNTKQLVIPVSSEIEREREIKQRRNNIIDGLKGLAAEMGITNYMLELFSTYQLEENLYVESGSDALYRAIENDTTTPWLNSILPNTFQARFALLLHLQHGIITTS